ncbi:MAG: DUF4352 domain-containing protein [Lachnospiraceae bacterium]|jgi:hypothetical protein|nr:DUF4352 domain-containing protein [Lachnospiraceae bacterium]
MVKRFKILVTFILTLCFLCSCANAQPPNEDVTDGILSETYHTQWFDFTVKDVRSTTLFNQYSPYDETYQFLIVTIEETNTYKDPLPMSCWDYKLEADSLQEEDHWARSDFEEDPNIMPTQFELEPNETVTYELVYCIPIGLDEVTIVFTEIDEKDRVGATYRVKFTVPTLFNA